MSSSFCLLLFINAGLRLPMKQGGLSQDVALDWKGRIAQEIEIPSVIKRGNLWKRHQRSQLCWVVSRRTSKETQSLLSFHCF
ncbi:hypothetical protein F4778DRAFT_724078 [Xylariomycetidae sp. FL2044]|nr:hypothetical protein F4778DRAFT_724078 [Xylariomycetidae sp. FL2044]